MLQIYIRLFTNRSKYEIRNGLRNAGNSVLIVPAASKTLVT